jgi:hypothetical protein
MPRPTSSPPLNRCRPPARSARSRPTSTSPARSPSSGGASWATSAES